MYVHLPHFKLLQIMFTAKTCGVFKQGMSSQQKGDSWVFQKAPRYETQAGIRI